ncbi:MAG: serine/threonine-protein phosphatase [Lachnospiraceae bacterium]|nr:serine/threonine-protein phosphatase [Lachnospiraceae bacterium]
MVRLKYRLANLQGVGKRERQEDSFVFVNAVDERLLNERGLFFAVCDGMGGMADGALASQTAVTSLKDSFQRIDRSGDMAVQLKDIIYKASEEVEKLIGGDGGSTVVAGIVYEDALYFASVGDSFLWLLRDGQLCRFNREMNVCHRQYMEEIRDGVIDPGDFQELREATALTGFLGMRGLDDIDCCVRPLPLRENDVILACSDGVGGVIVEDDVLSALSSGTEQEMCTRLEQLLVDYSVPNQDNYTAVVVRCES